MQIFNLSHNNKNYQFHQKPILGKNLKKDK